MASDNRVVAVVRLFHDMLKCNFNNGFLLRSLSINQEMFFHFPCCEIAVVVGVTNG